MQALLYSDEKPISIEVKEGIIHQITRGSKEKNQNSETVFVAPGFIDHQINGYLSHAFVGDDLDEEKVKIVTQGLQQYGTTTYLPTLTTESDTLLLKNFEKLNSILNNPKLAQCIPGFHLEGPYISSENGFRGAHSLEYTCSPNWEQFSAWYQASGNRILEVTIAPELDGAMGFIKKCVQNNIKVALGHTNASTQQINEAVSLGATISTHLGNGCANTIHRHNNPIWPQLANDNLYASIIVDGFHLTQEEVQTFYKVKGLEKTILTSDITRWAGMPPGIYQDFGVDVEVTKAGAIVMPSQQVLAGASFLIHRGIENMVTYTGCSLADAIDMSTKNPAKALNLTDRGEIAIGKRADLVYFTYIDGKIDIIKTLVGGKTVFEKK